MRLKLRGADSSPPWWDTRRHEAKAARQKLIAFAIGASEKFRVPYGSAGNEVVGNFVITLGEAKKPLPYLVAVMR
jgi:hypothetical protein